MEFQPGCDVLEEQASDDRNGQVEQIVDRQNRLNEIVLSERKSCGVALTSSASPSLRIPKPLSAEVRSSLLFAVSRSQPEARDAVGDLTRKFLCLNEVYPDGFLIPRRFIGENIIHLPTVKTHVFTTTTGGRTSASGGLASSFSRRPATKDLLRLVDRALTAISAVGSETATDGPSKVRQM